MNPTPQEQKLPALMSKTRQRAIRRQEKHDKRLAYDAVMRELRPGARRRLTKGLERKAYRRYRRMVMA